MADTGDFLVQLKQNDRTAVATCFSLDRYGSPNEDIALRLDLGPDLLRPWQPYIALGTFRIHRDYAKGEDGVPLGCVFHPQGETAVLHRGELVVIDLQNGGSMPVLRRPSSDLKALVHVDLRIPHGGRLLSKGRPINVLIGAIGSKNTIVYQSRGFALVQMDKGSSVDLFFADGAVRRFRWNGNDFTEMRLSQMAMAEARVKDATSRLERAMLVKDENERQKAIDFVLQRMAELLAVPGADQVVVEKILRDFFLVDPDKRLSPVHRKVTAILHNSGNEALVSVLYEDKRRAAAPVREEVDLSALGSRFKVINGGKKSGGDRKAERRERDRERTAKEHARGGGQKGPKAAGGKKGR